MTVTPIDPKLAKLASGYGWRELEGRRDLHTGIDLAAPEGTPVRAVRGARVLVSDPPGVWTGYGNVIVLEHPSSTGNRNLSLYAHLRDRFVAAGELVTEGQTIGTVGRTGGARGEADKLIRSPHLHFELLTKWPAPRDENRIDPTRLWPPALRPAATATPQILPPAPPPASSSSGLQNAFLLYIGWRLWQSR